jgi:hypothetical protein
MPAMILHRSRRRRVAASAIVASLLVSLGATPASAGGTWSQPRTAAAPFSWTPGKALASSSAFVLSAWASDCPPPKHACATNHGPHMGVFVQRARSDTTGLRWSGPRRVSPGNVQAERATIAARGTRVIAGWVTQTKVTGYKPGARRVFWVRRSRDQGKHWGAPIRLSAAKGRVDYPRVALAGGRAFAVWSDGKTGNIRLSTSTDGGAHWSTKTIGSTNAHAGRPREGRSGLPDLGASGQNLAITWYTNDQGRQVILTSATGGDDLDAGSTPLVLANTSPPNGIRYAGAVGAGDGASNRVAVAYTTPSGIATRVWNGTTLGSPSAVVSWPLSADGQTYADGYGPAVLPSGSNDLMVAFAGCRARPIGDPCNTFAPAARVDVLVVTSTDDGGGWGPANAVADSGKLPYRTNAEPSLALSGSTFRLSFDRYQSTFKDYRVWIRSSA